MKNQAPNSWTIKSLLKSITEAQCSKDGKIWRSARPLGLDTIPNRLRLAWNVFTGKADALFWND
jgi:hypothetical protein